MARKSKGMEPEGGSSISRRRLLTWLALSGLVLRTAAVLVLNRIGFAQPNSEHWFIGRSLFEGRGFAFDWYGLFSEPQVGSFLPPLYAWLISLFLQLTGGRDLPALWIAQGMNVLLGTATIALVAGLAGRNRPRPLRQPPVGRPQVGRFRILRRISDDPAVFAAAVWAVYPPALGFAVQPQTLVLETFLLALVAWLVLRFTERPGEARGISPTGPSTNPEAASGGQWGTVRAGSAAGAVLGLLILTRPTALLIWIAWAVYLILRRPDGPAAAVPPQPAPSPSGKARRAIVRYLLCSTAVAALVVLPWTLRNLSVHGRLVAIATNGGFNFYVGNSPGTHGGIPPLPGFFQRLPEREQEMLRALPEVERDRALYRRGLQFWSDAPLDALRSVGRKLIDFVLFRPYLFAGYPWWVAWIQIVSYLALLVPFLVALPRCRAPACMVPVLAVAMTGVVALAFVVSMRFRATVEPFFAVVGARAVSERLAARRSPRPAD